MKGEPFERAIECAKYIIETGATARQTAKKFRIAKNYKKEVLKYH